MFFLYTYLFANTLEITATSLDYFSIDGHGFEKKLGIRTDDLSFSSPVYNMFIKQEMKNYQYDNIQIKLLSLEIAQYWMPFLLSSILGNVNRATLININLYIEGITEDFEEKILFNISFFTINEMKINNKVINQKLIENYRKFFIFGMPYWACIKEMGWNHVKNCKTVNDLVNEIFYPQIQEITLQLFQHINNNKLLFPEKFEFKIFLKQASLINLAGRLNDSQKKSLTVEEFRREISSAFHALYKDINSNDRGMGSFSVN